MARVADLQSELDRQLRPILAHHGLTEPLAPDRTEAEGSVSRLFVLESPARLRAVRLVLRRDPAWQEALVRVASELAPQPDGGPLPHRLDPYRVTALPGRETPVGPGTRRGPWLSYGVADGLPTSAPVRLCQVRDGRPWFTACPAGIASFDGARFTLFTEDEGLPFRTVSDLAEDPEGHLWLVGLGGVARFDGREFAAYTVVDGLPAERVHCVLRGRQGDLWVGTDSGVSRYDGCRWRAFGTADGLPSPLVESLGEDRAGILWAGTGRGTSHFDGTRFARLTCADGLPGERIGAIHEDAAGDLWLAAYGAGICRVRDGRPTECYTTADGLDRVGGGLAAPASHSTGRTVPYPALRVQPARRRCSWTRLTSPC
ncbi:MAG: two-component regulator propeller domain-containing protein, partial [Candidatus Latescibacterota bacterium]